MEFGATPTHIPFDLGLAPVHPGSLLLLSKKTISTPCKIWVGAPQWNMFPVARSLPEYASIFNSIELNVSFYQIPKTEQVSKWDQQTNESFGFFVKVHQGITHDPVTRFYPEIFLKRLDDFVTTWTHLGSKLKGCFLQLAPDFSSNDMNVLQRWLDAWPAQIPLFVEFRHPSWFDPSTRQITSLTARLLARYRISTVCTDTPGRRDASHGTLTSTKLMVRFLGQSTKDDPHPISRDIERIELWVERFKLLQEQGLEEFSFFLHTPDLFHAGTLAEIFSNRASSHAPIVRLNKALL